MSHYDSLALRLKAPTADTENNDTIIDVLGNKTDTATGQAYPYRSVMGFQHMGYMHVHSPAEVYPEGADPILLTSGNGSAWLHGTKTQVIPASTITSDFDIHWVIISEISANDDFELKLYSGDTGETEIGTIAFYKSTNFIQEGNLPIQIPVQDANTKISASLACGDGDGKTCKIKLYYHVY